MSDLHVMKSSRETPLVTSNCGCPFLGHLFPKSVHIGAQTCSLASLGSGSTLLLFRFFGP